MHFDVSSLDPKITYKLMAASIVPRPIAWVVTRSNHGDVNAAPFSFFNAMGPDPATIALGIEDRDGQHRKDTARNIVETGEFVVNLVPFALAEAMNMTAVDAPTGTNELTLAKLSTSPSVAVGPPRIAASPVAFECVKHTILETGPHQMIVIGRVVAIHVEDRFVKDAERGHVDTDALDLIGRTFGSGYVRTRDRFDMVRPSWKTFKPE